MRKLTIYLAIAIQTFALGTVVATLWAESKATASDPATRAITKAIPEGWQKIEEQKFSLYLPPDMKVYRDIINLMDVDSSVEGMDMYAKEALWIQYVYGKKSPCEPQPAMAFHFSAVEVAGKSAKLFVYQPDETLMDLCISDIGDGKTRLWLRASGRDMGALNAASQVFESIELK